MVRGTNERRAFVEAMFMFGWGGTEVGSKNDVSEDVFASEH